MYEIPPDPINPKPTERIIPTNEDSLKKGIAEIDIPSIRQDYLAINFHGILNWFRLIFRPHLIFEKKIRLRQLDFLAEVIRLCENRTMEIQAYVLLGALQYVQGRWLKFPATGIFFKMLLKQHALIQIISENDKDIKLEMLFDNPVLISKLADEHFSHFLHQHSELEEW